MKIERISENQIRCTLSKEDLKARELRMSELAYGSEKAKILFQEMMQEASLIGFDAEDIPLMIEAIPVSSESLVLIVTKVEDPEELDTRFSRFTDVYDMEREEGGEFDLFDTIETDVPVSGQKTLSLAGNAGQQYEAEPETSKENQDMVCSFSFPTLEAVGCLSRQLVPTFQGESILYKDERKGSFFLFIGKGNCQEEDFNRYCNIASEYGMIEAPVSSVSAYVKEHCRLMIGKQALERIHDVFA